MLATELKKTYDCRLPRLLAALLAAFLMTAWTAVPASAQALSEGKGNLRVMNYNVYEGADLSGAFTTTTLPEFLAAIGAILANVQATNPPARAQAIARQIGKAQPTLVSLQEVTEWKTCPADSTFTGCTAPPTVLYDLLNLVKDALQAQGYSYKEVGRVTTNELSAPAVTNSGARIVFYTQRSAILARADMDPNALQLSNTQFAQFSHTFDVPTVVGTFSVHRAWISTDVKFHDTSFRFIDTQLEVFDSTVNYEQGEELLDGPANTSMPVVIAMDSNSKANPPADSFTPTYTNFLVNGFKDAWTEAQGQDAGPTCCQDPSLLNPVSLVTQRIDPILLHGNLDAGEVKLFGGHKSDRTSGLWPSDHLGVAAGLGTE
jgi:hypothetical protein